tara:strand:- start:67 stop:1431 length:1365 start_codon:yes stop_codon:yes gene_type:complete
MELDATGIEGRNQKLLELQTKFETLMKSAKDGLEVDASTLAATAKADITAAVSELRNLTPKLPELPNVNLQSQLSSLSGIAAGLPQHTQLLADITTKFGDALATSGFSLDTLVSDAFSAVTAGTSLSAKIPNFEVPAAGGDVIQKAIEVLQANPIKPEDLEDIAEKVSDLVESPNFIALKAELETTAETIAEQMKTIDISGLQLPEDTDITVEKLISDTENPIRKLPTNDDEYFSPTEEVTEVAFQHTIDSDSSAKRTVVSKSKVTTSENATTSKTSSVAITTSGGQEHVRTVSKKANISSHGFSYRPVEVTEKFYEDDVFEAAHLDFDRAVELENVPIKILHISGYVPTRKTAPHIARQIHPNTDYITIGSQAALSKDGRDRKFDVYRQPSEAPKEIEITSNVYKYGPVAARFDTVDVDGNTITKPHRNRGVVFKVTYQYADFYDPMFSSAGF